jgi:glycosyltransferase involved in cell wall biosynthesis
MKIGFVGVSPFASTGYGNQTRGIVKTLLNLGHSVEIFSHEGDWMVWGSRKNYRFSDGSEVSIHSISNPLVNPQTTVDIVSSYCKKFSIDFLIGHWDAFALGWMKDVGVPYITYIPVETAMTPTWYNYVKDSLKIVSYSKYGYKELSKFAPPSQLAYIPHGIDTSVFEPSKSPKSILRKKIKSHTPIPPDDSLFLFTTIGTNYGERKCLPLLLRVFSKVCEKFPNAHLYLHTNPVVTKIGDGYNLPVLVDMFGISDKVHYPEMNPILEQFEESEIALALQSSDCYVTTSMGEGFGIPLLEAASCGIPIIAPDNSSQSELTEDHGIVYECVPEEEYVHYHTGTPYLSYYRVPSASSLYSAMVEMIKMKDSDRKALGEKGRMFSLEYDWGKVSRMWARLVGDVETELLVLNNLFLPSH